MKVCFPVQNDQGIESAVYNHFGSAPVFVVIDTVANTVMSVSNRDQHHAHGACNPIKALDNQQVDAVIVGGIGGGALGKLNAMGIAVHRAQGATIRENLALLQANSLPLLTLQGCCGGHGHGHGGGCSH